MLRLFIDAGIALLFLSAFYFKIRTPRDTIRNIRSYRIVEGKWAVAVAVLLLAAELSIGFGFAYDAFGRWKEVAAVGMLVFFLYALSKKNSRDSVDCGCFGSIHWLNRHPYGRNVAMILAIVAREWLPGRDASVQSSTLLLLLIVLLILAADLAVLIRLEKEYSADGDLRAL